jgi:hypothetical protein
VPRKGRSQIWVQLGCNKTSARFLRAPKLAVSTVEFQSVTSETYAVTAVAGDRSALDRALQFT